MAVGIQWNGKTMTLAAFHYPNGMGVVSLALWQVSDNRRENRLGNVFNRFRLDERTSGTDSNGSVEMRKKVEDDLLSING